MKFRLHSLFTEIGFAKIRVLSDTTLFEVFE